MLPLLFIFAHSASCERCDGLMLSAVDMDRIEQSVFEPWPGALHCVLGEDNLILSQRPSSPRCTNGYRQT